ncbi:UNVERIFIED_CONTAM: hypothetical protein NCL1_59436 [Trichonephila clavipes]
MAGRTKPGCWRACSAWRAKCRATAPSISCSPTASGCWRTAPRSWPGSCARPRSRSRTCPMTTCRWTSASRPGLMTGWR